MRILAAVLAASLLASCSSESESLPDLCRRAAALMREGAIGEALDCTAGDFTAHGLERGAVRLVLETYRRRSYLHPLVADVVLDPEEDGQDTRRVVVLGLLPGRHPAEVRPAGCRPFRVDATARRDEGVWRIVSARLSR